MIVGNGIIARSVSPVDREELTIFASGVSDSSCKDHTMFNRERELLLSQTRITKIIYFSTCSLSDGSEPTEYLRHKLEMENLVSQNFEDWLILRLPTVVGRGGNPNNFFNRLSCLLREGSPVSAQRFAIRHLLDADDIARMIGSLIGEASNTVVDVCIDNGTSALEIVETMKQILGSKSEIEVVEDNRNHSVDNAKLNNFINKDIPDAKDYNERLIKKYSRL